MLRMIRFAVAAICIGVFGVGMVQAVGAEVQSLAIVLNPYENVDWKTVEHHRAALHTHTLQSDGRHPLAEVVAEYRKAGFTILAITDHDNMKPRPEGRQFAPDERPDNYPANITWPWVDYGGPAPDDVKMVGIKGNELSYRHHMNSLFNDFGIPDRAVEEDDLLLGVKRHGGLAFLNHPGIDADWWTRRPVEWYVERFEKHGGEYLVGIEVTNAAPATEKYDEGLWDQLLARFMPNRPIWGFGTDDMHALNSVRESDSVFLLEELTEDAVRAAMETGRFYFRKSNRRDDLRQRRPPEELFPRIESIEVDEEATTITVRGSNYDSIVWISAPESLEPSDDFETSPQPWPLGRVVHEGESLNYRQTPNIRGYVRVELRRKDGEDLFRTFTNPIGFAPQE